MHWLQALDTSLFLFVNRSLANPVFDWLMPILSGNAFFFPALFLLGVGLLWKGNARLRLCVLLLVLILPLGDGLVTNTIKHAVARPRPFVTLPEARLFGTVGKGYVPPETGDNGSGHVRQQRQPHQHAFVARGQLVCRHDDSFHLLPAQPLVHAADGARRLVFARL